MTEKITLKRQIKPLYITEKNKKKVYLKAFLLALGVSALFFLPFIIYDKGYFLFYGDYNVQQIPFYKLAHESVKTGNLFWSWYTDLGANFVGSYSFYLLGSPFFYLTLPFPNEAVPYLMGPLFCLKFAVAATTATAFMARFTKNQRLAILGGILYSFSAFSIYNIFFNHFHDVVAFFPLLLIGLEDFMKKERRGFFAFAVFINASINYFFFVGQVVFLIIYVLVRVSTRDYEMTVKKFISLAIESVLGFMLSLWILLPSVLAILGNPRISEFPEDWSAILYHKVQRYPQIFGAFFFPPELPSFPNFYRDAEAKWSSVAGWLPFVGMTGTIALMKSKKNHFIKKILLICILFAFVPILNSAFYAFNGSYYARWFYMPILLMALASVLTFEDKSIDLSFGLKVTANITMLFIVIIGFMPRTVDEKLTLGLYNYGDKFWAYCVIAMFCVVGMIVVYRLFYRSERFNRIVLILTCVVSVITSITFIAFGKNGRDKYDEIHSSLQGWENFNLPDDIDTKDQFYRIDVLNGTDNQAMFWHMPTIQTFHSVVPGSIMEFYPSIGVPRDVGSRPETNHVGVRDLTSVKYLMVKDEGENTYPNMPDYEYYSTQHGFKIFKNLNYIPMGYTYNHYMTKSQFENMSDDRRENALLAALYIDEETELKYSGLIESANYDLISTIIDDDLKEFSAIRKDNSCYYFSRDNKGFDAKIKSDKDNLLFFSVPFEKGWSATVNGEPADIEKVNVGFMAVKINKGENEIRFNYMTPGLKLGFLLMALGAILFVIYITVLSKHLKSDKKRNMQLSLYNDDFE